MPGMPSDRCHGYPLTAASRRRRRLALRHDIAPDSESAALSDELLVVSPPSVGVTAAPITGQFDAPTENDERMTRVLAARDPRTWLLIGESFQHPSDSSADWPSWVDRFTFLLRGPLGRRQDVVIDACCADSRIDELAARLETGFALPSADAVILICGPADARAGVARLPRFEADLSAVVGRLIRPGAAILLGTSPIPWCHVGDSYEIAPDVYAEAIRACALEQRLLLVDHRPLQEQAATPPDCAGSWHDDTPVGLSPTRHAELARLLANALWQCHPDDADVDSMQSRRDPPGKLLNRNSTTAGSEFLSDKMPDAVHL